MVYNVTQGHYILSVSSDFSSFLCWHTTCNLYTNCMPQPAKFQSLPPKAESKISSPVPKFILNIEHDHTHFTSCIGIIRFLHCFWQSRRSPRSPLCFISTVLQPMVTRFLKTSQKISEKEKTRDAEAEDGHCALRWCYSLSENVILNGASSNAASVILFRKGTHILAHVLRTVDNKCNTAHAKSVKSVIGRAAAE